MPARLLDGKALAQTIRARLREEAAALPSPPVLACLWAGDDPGAAAYRRGLSKACADTGVRFLERPLPGKVGEAQLLEALAALNDAPEVAGILVQTPLPAGVDASRVLAAVDPRKDAEGLSPTSLGLALKGDAAHAPCTARAAFELVRASGIALSGAEAVVVGASDTVGKPAALLLSQARATVTLCRSATRDLAAHVGRAEVLVLAVGRPGLVTGAMLRPGAVVVDVGINTVEGRIVGDADFASASEAAGWITPVPGGVGPVTVAMLLDRVVASARSALARA